MSDNCAIIPKVKNANGELVESRLFKDLLHYTSNRETSKEFYTVGTSQEFLDRVGSEAKFDDNGEITFQSLRNLAKIDLGTEKVKRTLNADIGAGTYEYSEAVPRLQTFNRSNPYNDRYLATLVQREDGKVELKIVENNKTNLAKLKEVVSNRSLKDRIMFYLNRAGADASFMTEGDKSYSNRYSTKNATRTADGLIQLIEVSEGNKANEALAEEAGHFAIGALGKSPLVARLTQMLTPELQERIMGDDYKVVVNREDSAREVAGYLVGQAIAGHIDHRAPWQNLVNRIVNQVKRIFNTIKRDEVANAKLQAEMYAEDIAKGFMSPNFAGSAEIAMETRETLYSTPDSINVKQFKSVLAILHKQAAEMGAINQSLSPKYQELVGLAETGRLMGNPSMFADIMAVDGITNAVDLLINTLPEMIDKLARIDYNTTDITPENANALREVSVFVQNANAVLKVIQDATATGSSSKLQGVNENVIEHLKKLRATLNEAINGDNRLLPTLEIKQREFFMKFLESVLGTPYVSRAARIVYDWKKGQKGLRWASAENVSIDDLLRYMDKDVTYLESYLTSMSNSSDVIGQLADKAAKISNKLADDMTIQSQDRLRVLEKELNAIGVKNTVEFCEVSPRTGKVTGNIISEYLWGDWEDDWLRFKKEARDEFLANNNLSGKSEMEKSALWHEYFSPLAKHWHKSHSKFDTANLRWTPNDTYKNESWNSIKGTPKEQWLNKYMALKRELDGFLPDGSTNPYRMPQFKGRTMNRIRNRKLFESTGKAIAHTLRKQLAETFVEDSEDTDFGSDQTYNTIEEDMFTNQLEFEKEKINRVPLYGINKLKDMDEISTDLFHSTLAYAGMAHSYAALNSIASSLEIGRDVLRRRQVGGLSTENERKETSNAYKRYQKFLDKQLYGINTKKIVFGKVVWNKVVGFFTGLASKFFLGGNVLGGAVNLGTGALEIFKEAIAAEHFTVKDWTTANKIYWKDLPSNWIHAGDDVKQDKVSLFIRHMNALNENKKNEREYFTERSKLTKLNPFGENLFLPYKSGEHYMQTMSYLAMANNTKLVDGNGNPISLYNCYQVVPIDENKPELGNTLTMRTDVRVVDESTGELREWSFVDESEFINKAREVNNRMHGIYNNQDKTMFQQSWYGNALLAMRGYALGMLQRRLGSANYSVALGHESEGSLNTLSKVLLSAFTDRGGVGLTARAIFLPTSKKVQQEMLNAGFSANQYANMRRNWADMLVISALFLMKALFAKGGDDDDDDDDQIQGMLYYAASRLFSEQAAFNTPQGFVKEAPTITNISPVGFSLAQDLVNIAEMFVTQEEYKARGDTYEKGDLKWVHKVERLLPWYRSYLSMQNPYKAAEGYQYGRATTVR